MIKTCEGCGNEYEAKTVRSRRCKKNCGRVETRKGTRVSKNASRTDRRANSGPFFIGIDGEGVTRVETVYEWMDVDGEVMEVPVQREVHYYDMLSVGDNTYCTPDGNQMHYEDALQHIWDSVEEYRAQGHERICLVGFFLGYDFIQIFRSLDQKSAWKLFSKEGQAWRRALQKKNGWMRAPKVRVGPWKLDMLANKRLTIQHVDHKDKSVVICDTGAFFQSAFLTAINPADWSDPVCTQEEYEIIVQGKSARGNLLTHEEQMATRPATIQYNITENLVLARLMMRLDEGFRESGIHLRSDQFYGPGQAAQTWMKNIGAPTTNEIMESVPQHIADLGQSSYYGGWFEIFCHGHIPGTTHEYDITSAYPDIIKDLPCLVCGDWTPDHEGTLRIARYHVRGPADAVTGPVPHRRRDGSILRPLETRGYHWANEIEAAQRAGLIDEIISIDDCWSFNPGTCEHSSSKPFEEIADLFLQRIRVGKKTPAGKALKLVYNSSYGKTAQSVGSPKYACSIYASLITSGCRTKILNAIGTHPNKAQDLVMVATDAVFFRTPHPNLDMTPNTLGAWEDELKENLTLFMPGVYWDDNSRNKLKQGEFKLKSRGISARELAKSIDTIDRQFAEWDGTTYQKGIDPDNPDAGAIMQRRWPTLALYSDFGIVSLGQALSRNKWYLAGTLMTYEEPVYDGEDIVDVETRTGVKRVISADAKPKRLIGEWSPWSESYGLSRDGDVWRSKPYPYCVDTSGARILDTVPYDKSFGFDLAERNELGTAVTPDGEGIGAAVRFLNMG